MLTPTTTTLYLCYGLILVTPGVGTVSGSTGQREGETGGGGGRCEDWVNGEMRQYAEGERYEGVAAVANQTARTLSLLLPALASHPSGDHPHHTLLESVLHTVLHTDSMIHKVALSVYPRPQELLSDTPPLDTVAQAVREDSFDTEWQTQSNLSHCRTNLNFSGKVNFTLIEAYISCLTCDILEDGNKTKPKEGTPTTEQTINVQTGDDDVHSKAMSSSTYPGFSENNTVSSYITTHTQNNPMKSQDHVNDKETSTPKYTISNYTSTPTVDARNDTSYSSSTLVYNDMEHNNHTGISLNGSGIMKTKEEVEFHSTYSQNDILHTGIPENNTLFPDHNNLYAAEDESPFWKVECDIDNSESVRTITLVVPIATPHLVARASWEKIRWVLEIVIDVSFLQANQCDITQSSFRHKCPSDQQCVLSGVDNAEGGGLQLGSYRCICSDGYLPQVTSGPVNLSLAYMEGRTAEQIYYQGAAPYNATLVCVPCSGTSCEGNASPLYSLVPDPTVRLPLLAFTSVTMLAVLFLAAVTFRFRNDKVMRASSPGLLFVTLLGSVILYAEVIVAAVSTTNATCMLRPWIRHVGFTITYGAILFKTWRISVIMRVSKARMFRTGDTELYQKTGVLLLICMSYMLIWTLSDPVLAMGPLDRTLPLCQLKAWNFIAVAGEMIMLLWGGYLCYQSRKAPDLYNEATQISYAIWNEALWEIFIIILRILVYTHPDSMVLFVCRFLRTQLTISVTLLLLYGPKFLNMFRKIREVHGTLTDVHGAKRVHRLSLMVNKQGDIKTIYCVPCGPLAYVDQTEESDSSSQDISHDVKEDEYTKAEVDALIELVSKLKSERELYKMQTKRLLQLLRNTKRKTSNGLSPSLVAEDPSYSNNIFDYSSMVYDAGGHDGKDLDARMDMDDVQFYKSLMPGQRNSRASTVTTFVSSTPEDLSINDLAETDCCDLSPVSPTEEMGLKLSPVSCHTCRTVGTNGGNGVSKYAMTVIRRKLAQNHLLGKDLSPETEDFPKIIHSHEHGSNNNKLALRQFIPTVYGDVCDTNVDGKVRELVELSPTAPAQPQAGSPEEPTNSGKAKDSDNPDKLNFIMYI